jgi:hypothetical protein
LKKFYKIFAFDFSNAFLTALIFTRVFLCVAVDSEGLVGGFILKLIPLQCYLKEDFEVFVVGKYLW